MRGWSRAVSMVEHRLSYWLNTVLILCPAKCQMADPDSAAIDPLATTNCHTLDKLTMG